LVPYSKVNKFVYFYSITYSLIGKFILYIRSIKNAMRLIAKNKITQYILQHPEAQTAILTWLKEHFDSECIARMFENSQNEVLFSTSGIGQGEYQLKSCTNLPLKTTCIAWLGSKEELEAHEQARIAKMKAEKPGLTWEVKVKIVEHILEPPPPMFFDSIPQDNKIPSVIAELVEQQELTAEPPYVETDSDFKTVSQYEEGLARAIDIFEAKPGSEEFDELLKLIPLIAHYEQNKLDFPELKQVDVVNYKMNMFQITPQSLPGFIGTAEEIELFMAGKQTLAPEKIEWLCNLLWIKFRV
jgi:antitoxin component HigA of HigAB toxin-antitoxin module